MAAREMVILPPEKYKTLLANQRTNAKPRPEGEGGGDLAGHVTSRETTTTGGGESAREGSIDGKEAVFNKPRPPPGIPVNGLDSVFKEWYTL